MYKPNNETCKTLLRYLTLHTVHRTTLYVVYDISNKITTSLHPIESGESHLIYNLDWVPSFLLISPPMGHVFLTSHDTMLGTKIRFSHRFQHYQLAKLTTSLHCLPQKHARHQEGPQVAFVVTKATCGQLTLGAIFVETVLVLSVYKL